MARWDEIMRWVPVAILPLVSCVGLGSQAELHLFWAVGCPHCQVMEEFLGQLSQDYPELQIVRHEVAYHPNEWRLMLRLAAAYGIDPSETPVVFVGDVATVGIGRAVELRIAEEVARCVAEGCPSPLTRLPDQGGWIPSPLELSLVALAVVGLLYLVSQLTLR